MKADLLFRIANNVALLGWLLLIFLPRWRWAARLIGPALIPVMLSAIYATLVIAEFGHGGGFTSLSSVELLFHNRYMLLAGWVHYVAFDLFVGSWELRDAQRMRRGSDWRITRRPVSYSHVPVRACRLAPLFLHPQRCNTLNRHE